MKLTIEVGQTIKVSNSNGRESYLVTKVTSWGDFVVQRKSLPITKIGRIRFPETITFSTK